VSAKVPTAKVYVLKNPAIGEPGYDWKVGHLTWGDVFLVVYDALSFEDAWNWLYENYQRETP
jgi:hypothetical protein